jgi:hypothetical protein
VRDGARRSEPTAAIARSTQPHAATGSRAAGASTTTASVATATSHEAGTEAIGLLKAYDQNYYPSSASTLCEETAREYAEFFNRLGIRHHEYDGGECHCDVPWGFGKWAMFEGRMVPLDFPMWDEGLNES